MQIIKINDMTNNINYYFSKNYIGKGAKQRFGLDLWPDSKIESDSHKSALNNKVRGIFESDPKTLPYHILDRISELFNLTKIDELWLPLEKDN